MNANNKMPTTRNEAWGFWGTMENNAKAAWPMAMKAIAQATNESLDAARAFLDSKHGRHFADEVLNEMEQGRSMQQAIDAAIARWMSWTIGRKASKHYGIPKGMAYLTGFVIHYDMVDELGA